MLLFGDDFAGDLVRFCELTFASACRALSHSGISACLGPSLDPEFSLFSPVPGAAAWY